MIIANGTIEPKVKTGGGIDPATGYPVKPEVSWGDPIPCQFVPNTHNKLGTTKDGEHFTVATYVIYIEEQPFHAEQIRLTGRGGTVIGEFSVKQIEPLDAVCEVLIIV